MRMHTTRFAILTALLLCGQVNAQDSSNATSSARERAEVQPDATNKVLAQRANTLAAEDAIESVLQAMKQTLDIRLNGRKSGRSPEATADSR